MDDGDGRREPKADERVAEKTGQLYPSLNGSLHAVLVDERLQVVERCPISQIIQKLEGSTGVNYIVFDGIITPRLVDAAKRAGAKGIVGHRVGDFREAPDGMTFWTFTDFGLEWDESAHRTGKEIIREKEIHVIVKIPCRYCGVLNDQLRAKCESCGAALR